MQRLNGELLFSPSDLSGFLACEHLTQLELAVALQEGRRPSYENAYAELLRRKGEEHEHAFLAAIRGAGHSVVEVRRDGLRDSRAAPTARWTACVWAWTTSIRLPARPDAGAE